MFVLDLKVRTSGAEYDIRTNAYDLLVWEKTGRGKKLGDLLPFEQSEDGGARVDLTKFSLVELYRFAHIAARRLELPVGSLEEFEQTAEVSITGADDTDPTRPARSAGPSSSSHSNRASRRRNGQQRDRRRSSPPSTS